MLNRTLYYKLEYYTKNLAAGKPPDILLCLSTDLKVRITHHLL